MQQIQAEKEQNVRFIFSGRLNFISIMNTKSGIFTLGYATRENTAFGVEFIR